jgi:hypothetical protein
MESTSSITDPVPFLNALSADGIERRLHELHHEEAALRVLLPTARARERHAARARSLTSSTPKGERR